MTLSIQQESRKYTLVSPWRGVHLPPLLPHGPSTQSCSRTHLSWCTEKDVNFNSSGPHAIYTGQVQPKKVSLTPCQTFLSFCHVCQTSLCQFPLSHLRVRPHLQVSQTSKLYLLGATRTQHGISDGLTITCHYAMIFFVSLSSTMKFILLCLNWILLIWVCWKVLFVYLKVLQDKGMQSSAVQLIHLLFLLCHFHCTVPTLNVKNLMISP